MGMDAVYVPAERYAAVALLLGLVGGFGFIRTSTRMIRARVRWWPGNVSAGGVHLHHEFFGMLIMLVVGAVEFGVPLPAQWRVPLALLFGIGAGLVLDEFALLLRLRDVYWTREGQASIDAVVVAVLITGMLVVGAIPFGIEDLRGTHAAARWAAITLVCGNLAFTLLTAYKGKPWLALLSVALPPAGWVGAFRLAASTSPWARRRYRARPRKAARAARRTTRWHRRKERLVVLVGGAPDDLPDPDGDGRRGTTASPDGGCPEETP
ncbi:hypothetical protein DPM19_24555 [Actinomadura craniellae]|uniref:Integral membrane protein n=1 Tax=Actinomadura craniellae TaxID=2231787 RepID=A0A365GZR1_9ACTN|nr:hypothetical protein DPM19_24555 [Actinomadura craniellae]